MRNVLKFLKSYRLPILSGLLIGTSYIPFPPWALAFAIAPLFYFCTREERTLKETLIAGWITQFVLTLIGFHWIAYTAHEFGMLPWAVAIPILLLFSATAHVYFALAMGLGWWIQRKLKLSNSYSLLALALILAICETLWPGIFNWNFGYPLIWAGLPIAQLSDVVGFQSLSALMILTNAVVVIAYLRRHQKKQAMGLIFVVFIIFIGLNLVGLVQKSKWENPDQSLNVLQVQGNIGNMAKHQAERGSDVQSSILSRYIHLTDEGLKEHPETDLVIWPETAFPSFLDPHYNSHQHNQTLKRFMRMNPQAFLVGGYSKDAPGSVAEPRRPYNALFLFDSNGVPLAPPYRKSNLLAFGEYFPGREIVPQVEEWFPMVSNFGWGPGPTVFEWDKATLGAQICYEGLDPHFTRTLTLAGAEVIVNVTNDSWFGGGFEAYQHLYMTFARALENRRPLIRNTNTGITSAILADGQILTNSPTAQEWTGFYEIGYHSNPELTFYTRYGAWWLPFWFGVLIIILTLGGVRARASQSRLV